MSTKENKAQTQPTPGYTKEQIVSSKRFTTSDKDILTGLLSPDKVYTLDEVDSIIKSFKESEV